MITIGSRGSDLALWQANYIAEKIGTGKTEIKIIRTQGDRIQNVSFDKMEGKGFFTKELEEALLSGTIDCAVHSMKDLPTDEVPGLTIAAITEREDPSDILLIHTDCINPERNIPLNENATVGTSSVRRAAQLQWILSDINIQPLRGNVPTRVKKLLDKHYDAIVLANAGIKRLKINPAGGKIFVMPFDQFLPAPAQGALAIQIRENDINLADTLTEIHHDETARAVMAERFFLHHFGGGCHIPLGAFATLDSDTITLTGAITSADGKTQIRKKLTGDDPKLLGEELAQYMKKKGADTII